MLVFLSRVEDSVLAIGRWWNLRNWPALLLIGICFLPTVVLESRNTLLSSDEIYTVHIAQQPNLRRMFALAREIDLHPPIHYLAVREAMLLPGPRWLTARIPSILAGLVLCVALFFYSSKRLGRLPATAAVCVMWCTPAIEYSWSDRPYALWLALLWLLLLSLDWWRSSRCIWRAILVVLVASLLVMTHFLGCACLVVLAVAEALERKANSKRRWTTIALLCLPCLSAVWFHYQLHALSENVFPKQQLASLHLLGLTYYLITNNIVVIVPSCIGISWLITNRRWSERVASSENPTRTEPKLQRHDWVALVAFICFPILLFLPAYVLHVQFWTRYGAVSMPALGVLTAWGLSQNTKLARVSAVLVVCASVVYLAQRISTENHPQGNVVSGSDSNKLIQLNSLDSGIPIVAESPMTFTEMADREAPAITQRLYYLTDRDAALRFSRYTLFENEGKIVRLLNLPAKSEPLSNFLRSHDQFYVVGEYGRPEVWLLRKLRSEGYKLTFIGHFASSYETDELYLVQKFGH